MRPLAGNLLQIHALSDSVLFVLTGRDRCSPREQAGLLPVCFQGLLSTRFQLTGPVAPSAGPCLQKNGTPVDQLPLPPSTGGSPAIEHLLWAALFPNLSELGTGQPEQALCGGGVGVCPCAAC